MLTILRTADKCPPKSSGRSRLQEDITTAAYLELAKPSPSAVASGYRGSHSVIAPKTLTIHLSEDDVRRSHLLGCLLDTNKRQPSLESHSENRSSSSVPFARKRRNSAHMQSACYRPLGSNEYGCRSRRATGLCRRG